MVERSFSGIAHNVWWLGEVLPCANVQI